MQSLPPSDASALSEPEEARLIKLGRWHTLFDELCNSAGYFDDAALASAYCKQIGRNGRTNFDTVQKNLRQWRQGRRLPLRRNVVVLADLLGIAPGSALHSRWSYLYAVARGDDPNDLPADPASAQTPSPTFPLRHVARWGVVVACAIGGSVVAYSAVQDWRFDRLPLVDFSLHVKMNVGESRLINGLRGDCSAQTPPDWYYTRTLVPPSKLGIFTDAGIVRKDSVSCRKIIPVRGANFTALRPGIEQVELMYDLITIEVVDVNKAQQD